MRIKFIEKTHQYLTDDDREMISVSAFMKRFIEKKDWNKIAEKSAAKKVKEGNPTITKEQLLAKWARNRDIGTQYHAIREQELLNQNQPVFYNVPCETIRCDRDESYKYSIPINHLENNHVYPELMIYDPEYMICGQSDKVIIAGNTINIWDYKTDAEIKFVGFSTPFYSAKKFLPPIEHLEECNGNEYSLKMSLYMYMLWKSNKGKLKPGQLIIEHIKMKRDEEGAIILNSEGRPVVEGIREIEIPYRKKEVLDMVKTIK